MGDAEIKKSKKSKNSMIAFIQITNYQSHKKTTLELDKGVNVIVGKPDSGKGDAGGKTAILRALLWCMTNRPSGDAFRSHWGGDTLVKVALDNKIEIDRNKMKSENSYVLWIPSQKKNDTKVTQHLFKSFGQSVPDLITEMLRMDDINIQSQHDRSFMLSKSPGEAAQYLNSMVRLDVISSSLSSIGKMSRDTLNDITFNSSKIEETKADLVKFEGLDTIEKIITRIERLGKQVKGLRDDEMTLRNLLDEIDEVEYKLKDVKDTKEASKLVDKLIKLAEKNAKLDNEKIELEILLDDIDSAKASLYGVEVRLKHLNKSHDELMPKEGICPICNQRIKRK